MARKRKLKKKRIKQDQLVTTTLRVTNYVQDHFTQVISGLVILLAAVAIIVFTAQTRRNTARAADKELSLAMGQYQLGDTDLAGTTFASLADRYSGHESGMLALFFLGECDLDRLRWEEALSSFERFLDKAPAKHEFRVAAEMGRAYANEGLQNYTEAATILDDLSKRYLDHVPTAIGNFTLEFFDAGHILGSAIAKISAEGRSIVFSGDLGNFPPPIIRTTEVITNADYCVVECTYGDRVHEEGGRRRHRRSRPLHAG